MSDDLISREALKKVFGYTDEWYKGRTICAIIDNAPPIETTIEDVMSMLSDDSLEATEWFKVDTPSGEAVSFRREKTGEWITTERGYECSECGALHSDDYPFCHMCGADMRVREGG